MKQQLVLLARYDLWANERFAHLASALSPEQLSATVTSSFPSILDTFRHIYDTQYGWLAAMSGLENTSPDTAHFQAHPFDAFLETSRRLLTTIEDAAEEWIEDDITLTRNGRSFTFPVYGVLHHLLNHATYHRGQLTTLLRQAGITTFPRTDLIDYLAELRQGGTET